jgi:hypothetical protein
VVVDVDAGEIVTEFTTGGGGGAVTFTVAEPDFVVSATLVAVTVSVPAVAGAVYAPDPVMLPSEACHVTPLLVAVP